MQRTFQYKWKTGRLQLRYEVCLGMWCNICNWHKNNKIVIGIGTAANPLRVPTQGYQYYRVEAHENKCFHLHVVMLESQSSAHKVEGWLLQCTVTLFLSLWGSSAWCIKWPRWD